MAKVQYGAPSGGNSLTAQQLQEMLFRQQMLAGSDPSQVQGYDTFDQSNDRHPVYSIGQGLADVAGKVGSAYFEKQANDKLAQKLAAQEQANNKSSNAGLATAMNTGLYHDQNGMTMDRAAFSTPLSGAAPGAQPMAGLPGQPDIQPAQNMSWDQSKINGPALSPNERATQAFQQVAQMSPNGGLAQAMLPQLQEASKAAQPPSFSGQLAPGAKAFVDGKEVANAPAAPRIVGHSLMTDDGKVVGTAPRDALEDAKTVAETNKAIAETDAAKQKTHSMDDIPEGVTGPAVLDLLKPTERASVQAIIDGDQPLPTRTANPQGQRIAGLVQLADPTYNVQRIRVKNDVSSGQTSQNLKRIGTAIGHVDSLFDAMGGLNNTGIPILNAGINASKSAMGSGKPNAVETNADAVATELEAAFRGTGTSISGIHEWRKKISPNMSPDQQTESKQMLLDLLDSRLDSVANQWNQVMSPQQQREGASFLSPKEQAIYGKIKGLAPAAKEPAQMSDDEIRAALAARGKQ